MSRVASNFGRLEYDAHAAALAGAATVTPSGADDESVPDNVAGLRFGAKAIIAVSAVIACIYPPIGLGGIGAGVLYLLASAPAVTTTGNMDTNIARHNRLGGCFWALVTCAIGVVAFLAGLAFLGAMANGGR